MVESLPEEIFAASQRRSHSQRSFDIYTEQQSFPCFTRKISESTGPMRPRKVNAAPDNKNTPRANISFDNIKSKHVQEAKVKVSNIESKPLQLKKNIQKAKILNKATNHQALQIAELKRQEELKLLMQKSPAGVNKLAVQKKKLLTALKTKACIEPTNIEEIQSVPKVKKLTIIQKTTAQDKTTVIQKTKPQEEAPAAQKSKLENDPSILRNKTQDNETFAPIKKTKINSNSMSVQDAKSQENTPKIKPTSDISQKMNYTSQEKKPQETQEDDKVSPATTVENKKTDQSKIEVSSEEKYELDPLLARAIEEELQDVMIQVWQELPDDPLEEEDKIAVDKLRNEAGDDLRRILGLNITKRLLNVYNNLFIKMQFTCRPPIGYLTSFLNEYHINKFKRIDKYSNTFAAQMETIEDFDNLCAIKELMCGQAKVTVTPCYKFTQCPENLKTIYDDTYFYEDTAQAHSISQKSKNNTLKIKTIASNKNVVRPAIKEENIDPKYTDKPDRPETQKTANSVNNISEDIKKDSIIDDKQKTSDSSKIIADYNKCKEKGHIDNISKDKEISKDVAKNKDMTEYIIKDKLESDDDDDKFEFGVPECQMEGEDELDDEDILALMSEGVVLDECSGSEDEN